MHSNVSKKFCYYLLVYQLTEDRVSNEIYTIHNINILLDGYYLIQQGKDFHMCITLY